MGLVRKLFVVEWVVVVRVVRVGPLVVLVVQVQPLVGTLGLGNRRRRRRKNKVFIKRCLFVFSPIH